MPTARPKPVLRLPERQEVVYYSTASALYGCGYMLKSCPADGYVDRRVDDYVAVLVLRGEGRFVDWHGREHAVDAGCLIQHPPGRVHSVLPSSPDWTEFFWRFPADQHAALSVMGLVDERPLWRPGCAPELVERANRLLAAVRRASRSDLPALLVRMLDMLFAAQRRDGIGGTRGGRSMVDQACEALRRDVAAPLDMEALAQSLGISYERFRKVFREQVGVSPGEYRIRRRIDRARQLLLEDGVAVKEVAFRLGYDDPFSFSRQFKRFTGQSPSAFRNSA